MFTIDLFKGSAIPIRSRPEGIMAAAVTAAFPIITLIIILGIYLGNKASIVVANQHTVQLKTKISRMANELSEYRSVLQQQEIIRCCLAEIKDSINRHNQWSEILTEISASMPDMMILTYLSVEQKFINKKVLGLDEGETITVSVPVRTLSMEIAGNSHGDCDKLVMGFIERLTNSQLLKDRIETIRVPEKSNMSYADGMVSYKIDCLFKS